MDPTQPLVEELAEVLRLVLVIAKVPVLGLGAVVRVSQMAQDWP